MNTHHLDRTVASKANLKRRRPRQDLKSPLESLDLVSTEPKINQSDIFETWLALNRGYARSTPADVVPALGRLQRQAARAAVSMRAQHVKMVRAAQRDRERVSTAIVDQLRELIGQELARADEPRTARLDARLTAKERAVIQRAADISGRSLSDFVIHAAHQAALQEIEHQVILRLSKRDSETLAAALEAEPAEPTAAFKRAVAMRDQISRPSTAKKD